AQEIFLPIHAGGGYAACLGGLALAVEHAGFLEHIDRAGGGGHVGAFGDEFAAVLDQGEGVFLGDLVLRGAGKGAVAGDDPGALVGMEGGAGELLRVFGDAAAADVLKLHDPGELFLVDAGGVVGGARGVGERHGLGSVFEELLHGVLGDVAGAGDDAGLAGEGLGAGLEHFLGEIDRAVAGGLGADERAAPLEALAGEHAGEFVGDALVLAEQIPDLAAAHADVAGG